MIFKELDLLQSKKSYNISARYAVLVRPNWLNGLSCSEMPKDQCFTSIFSQK